MLSCVIVFFWDRLLEVAAQCYLPFVPAGLAHLLVAKLEGDASWQSMGKRGNLHIYNLYIEMFWGSVPTSVCIDATIVINVLALATPSQYLTSHAAFSIKANAAIVSLGHGKSSVVFVISFSDCSSSSHRVHSSLLLLAISE